jgi:nitroimidazol reductase NimA-like FMN-containing flavoprotein (pyridoxamine 5'-phosphate oxidase superfamily)
MTSIEPSSDRVRLRRMDQRGAYGRAAVFAVLDAGLVAHVGVATTDGPIVLPMAYGRTDDQLYLHGSVANDALRAAVGHDICVTVTVTDALIVARSPFHNSMNYRCAVVRGVARRVDDPDERTIALRAISDHITPTWDDGRAPTDTELRQTIVVAVELIEMSAKVRTGDPIDDAADLDGPHWAGQVPIVASWGAAVPAADLAAGIEVPAAVASMAGRPL